MPPTEQQSPTAQSCITDNSSITDSPSQPSCLTDDSSSAKASLNGGNSSPGAGKTSKRFVDEDSKSPEYRSDAWRMANFKVVPCSKRYAHDWTICPFAHPGEKARRRDPRIYKYAGIACPELKKAGFCSRGDKCPYAHNVFEFWLHPTRYRTQLCNDGVNCTRNVCFFAHTVEEMRPVPCKFSDTKREVGKGGTMSPDSPFLQPGSSLMTSSSTCSSDVWQMLSPGDRARSTSHLPDDFTPAKAQKAHTGNELVDDLANSLANVKIAMAGDKRDEVITMLSKLLHEAAEDKGPGNGRTMAQQPRHASQASHNHAAELSMALSTLDSNQAYALLADAQRRNLVARQLANTVPDAGQNWSNLLHQLLDNNQDSLLGATSNQHGGAGSHHLLTAPAALNPISRSGDFGGDYGAALTSRVLSADLNLTPQRNFWQNPGMHEFQQIQHELSQQHGSLPRGFSGDVDAASHQLPQFAMLDDKLFGAGPQIPLAAANPSALRKQSLNLEDLPHLPKPQTHPLPRREVRRPPISAFQNAATQDWKQPVGRAAAADLRWNNSGGRMSSCDLATINEGLPPLSYSSADLFQPAALENAANLPYGIDRSKSTSVETKLNLLPSPLAFPTTQPGGRDTSALHSAPYDLSLAYKCDSDMRRQSFDHQAALQRQSFDHQAVMQRQSFDHQPALQGWGGLHARDFSLNRF